MFASFSSLIQALQMTHSLYLPSVMFPDVLHPKTMTTVYSWAGFALQICQAVTEGLSSQTQIISLLTDNHYTSSQYFTICCSHNSFTKLFCLAWCSFIPPSVAAMQKNFLCSILLLVASDLRLCLPLLMHCGDTLPPTSLGVFLTVWINEFQLLHNRLYWSWNTFCDAWKTFSCMRSVSLLLTALKTRVNREIRLALIDAGSYGEIAKVWC